MKNYFQYRCYGDHPWLKSAGESLFREYLNSRTRRPTRESAKQFQRAFITALSGLYIGGAFRQTSDPILITLNKNSYNGKTQLSPVFQPELLAAFNWLISSGYLMQVSNEHQIDGRWVPRGYRLSSKWMDHIPSAMPHEDALLSTLRRNEFAPFIEIRAKDGRRLKLKRSQETTDTLQRLTAYESRLERHSITLKKKTLPPYLFSLTRIYSEDYSKGGRYYSAFQTKSSQFRLQIEIDGELVSEADYKALHPNLLYQLVSQEAPEDPYNLGDEFPRSAVKKAFQVLINRSKGGPATHSLIYWLGEHRRKGKPDPEDWRDFTFSVNKEWCQRLERRLRDYLKPIECYFCQGVGLQLQHYDSQLVSHVIDYFMVKTDSVVIPIHDSFLVKQRDLPDLIEAIHYAEVILAKEINRSIRVPQLKIEASRLEPGYSETIKNLGFYLGTSEELEDEKADLLAYEEEVYKNQVNDEYLQDLQIEQSREEAEGGLTAY